MDRSTPTFVSGRLRLGLAAGVLAIGALTVLVDGFGNARRYEWMGSVQLVVAVLVLAWLVEAAGRRWPRLLLAAIVAGAVGWLISLRFDDVAPLYLFVLVSWVHLTSSRRNAVIATVLAALALTPTLRFDPTTFLTWAIGVVSLSAGTGAILEQRRLLADLRAAQADLAREAAAAERRRIAREIHDLIAHSLSVTMLHLTAARHILQRDPARAAEALAEAERLGRESLVDVRRTVGLLDPGTSDGDVAAPVPTAAEIPSLVDEYRRAGLQVALDVKGDLDALPAATGLALYRIAQEALANVVKHAPGGQAEVTLVVDAGVTLRVRSSGPRDVIPDAASPGPGVGGLGLVGMRERVSLVGGSLIAGPDGDGWLIECVVPLANAAPTEQHEAQASSRV